MDILSIEERLRHAILKTPPPRGDSDLNPGMRPLRPDLIDAAVLIPLIQRDEGPTVLLTRRTAHLRDHGGQIAFPGGRRDLTDASLIETALRETEEEVAIARHQVQVLGQMVPYVTRTGYTVTPVIGSINPPITPRPEPREVDEIFEVPLHFLLNRANHQRHSQEVAGVKRHFYAIPFGNFYIWGATAGMIVNLTDILETVAEKVMDDTVSNIV
jgi:8-oxo-dGTP pyrophosphatase MutT (NUDIX family)